MEISVSGQAATLGGALLLGMAVGLCYDIIRIPRAYLRLPLLGGALDLLFWLIVTATLFLYATAAGGGEVRIFMAAALFGGTLLYFLVFSPWLRKFIDLVAAAVAAVWRFLTFPLIKLASFLKIFKEKLKNTFSSCLKRYRMNVIPENAKTNDPDKTEKGRRRRLWRKPKRRGF